jgi:hypothetical protein
MRLNLSMFLHKFIFPPHPKYRCVYCDEVEATSIGGACADCLKPPPVQVMRPARPMATAANTALQAVAPGAAAYYIAGKDLNCPSPYLEAMTVAGACACGICYVCHTHIYSTQSNLNSLPPPIPHALRTMGVATCNLAATHLAGQVYGPIAKIACAVIGGTCAICYHQYYAAPYRKPKRD